MRSPSFTLVSIAAVFLVGCATEVPPLSPYAARQVVELARWQVFDGTELVGVLLHLEIRTRTVGFPTTASKTRTGTGSVMPPSRGDSVAVFRFRMLSRT